MTANRLQEIQQAITTLETFNSKGGSLSREERYSIIENGIFLKAISSLPRYITWLSTRAKKIDGSQLMELTDFPVPEWDMKMHRGLIEVQRDQRLGLIKPVVSKILNYIESNKQDLIIVDLGFGGMEIERQVIEQLLKKGSHQKITFLGVDKSSTTHKIAADNLSGLKDQISFFERDVVNREDVEWLVKDSKNITVILCKNDIFKLNDMFPNKYFNLIFHSLFKHHLSTSAQNSLDSIIRSISKNAFEFDGYKSFAHLIPQSIAAWKAPIFLNGTVFSMLRYKDKRDITKKGTCFFSKTAHYLSEL